MVTEQVGVQFSKLKICSGHIRYMCVHGKGNQRSRGTHTPGLCTGIKVNQRFGGIPFVFTGVRKQTHASWFDLCII